MFRWSLPQAACVLSVFVSLALAYEDDIEVNYSDNYYNEITEGDPQEPTPSTAPCKIPDLTKWDKLFSMLENSQMRENMLLQYADDIVKVEMGSLRGEMLRFVAQYGGSCGAAVETAGRRMSLQLVAKFREVLDRLNPQESKNVAATGNSAGNSNNLEMLLQQLLSATRTQTSRLTKLETSCFSNAGAVMGTGGGMPSTSKMGFEVPQGRGGHRAQDVTSQQTKTELEEVLRSSRQRYLPAGCEMALLFPMRSRRIYTSIIPDVPLSLSSFTVCLWAKPTAVLNKTVLYSYGTRRNPYEIQLLLSRTSALFTVGGEAHLVEARGVVNEPEWIHLCGTWSSKQGLASLWADGRKVASTPGVAEGHILPDGGSLQLGQERNGCCPGSPSAGGGSGSGVPGFEGGFEAKLAFPGKMTGVNMWNRVLSDEEISQMALRDGSGCEMRGNMVAWGVTEMVPHGGAQFIN
ncbi:pentraxin-related protein PTX3 isoform X1 [Myripristis murdjan]|uniref:pentraxin-related protein PTX3 isoform X1 n=1 Tax=Myripristis murdjan TaxID=586833 RepID=UPI0011764864|nr:pentraxin-related protein PTX3 isoform X1 [Myripristis murdjan]